MKPDWKHLGVDLKIKKKIQWKGYEYEVNS